LQGFFYLNSKRNWDEHDGRTYVLSWALDQAAEKEYHHTLAKIHQGDVDDIQHGRCETHEDSHTYVWTL